jgi:hypothetical protein
VVQYHATGPRSEGKPGAAGRPANFVTPCTLRPRPIKTRRPRWPRAWRRYAWETASTLQENKMPSGTCYPQRASYATAPGPHVLLVRGSLGRGMIVLPPGAAHFSSGAVAHYSIISFTPTSISRANRGSFLEICQIDSAATSPGVPAFFF